MNPLYILKSAQRVTKQQIKAVLKVTFCVRDAQARLQLPSADWQLHQLVPPRVFFSNSFSFRI